MVTKNRNDEASQTWLKTTKMWETRSKNMMTKTF
jgi:hypothetical protein